MCVGRGFGFCGELRPWWMIHASIPPRTFSLPSSPASPATHYPNTSLARFSKASIMMPATLGPAAWLKAAYTGFANCTSITSPTSVRCLLGSLLASPSSCGGGDPSRGGGLKGNSRRVQRESRDVKMDVLVPSAVLPAKASSCWLSFLSACNFFPPTSAPRSTSHSL